MMLREISSHTINIQFQVILEINLFSKLENFMSIALIKISPGCAIFAGLFLQKKNL